MKKEFTILIADRNPHVREFLKREMVAEGYKVQLAENAREVIKKVYAEEPLDLLIIDLDLPDSDQHSILEKLQKRPSAFPVVVHTFIPKYLNHPALLDLAIIVEKEGNSIDRLKQVALEIRRKSQGRGIQDPQIRLDFGD